MPKKLTFLVLNESQEVFQTDQGQNCPRSAWKALDGEQVFQTDQGQNCPRSAWKALDREQVFQTDQGQNCPRSAWKVLDREQPESKMGNTKFTLIINSKKT